MSRSIQRERASCTLANESASSRRRRHRWTPRISGQTDVDTFRVSRGDTAAISNLLRPLRDVRFDRCYEVRKDLGKPNTASISFVYASSFFGSKAAPRRPLGGERHEVSER